MKEKIKKILNPGFLVLLLAIVLMFSLTTYWRVEAQKTIREWQESNGLAEGEQISGERFDIAIKYKAFYWDITYRKIWIYDLLILAAGILLFIGLKQDNKDESKN